MKKTYLGFLAAIITGVTFGIAPLFAKFAYGMGASVLTVLAYRFLMGVVLVWLYLYYTKSEEKPESAKKIKLILLGATIYAGMSGSYMFSYTTIPASLSAMLLYLFPLLVTIAAIALKQEKFSWDKGIALVVTLAGLFLLLQASFTAANMVGIIAGLGAAVMYAMYVIIGDRVIKGMGPLNATMYISLGGGIAYFAAGLFSGNLQFPLTPLTWVMILGMSMCGTIIGTATFWIGASLIGPSKTSIICTIEPLVTASLSCWMFSESMTLIQWLGGLLIIAAVVLLQYTSMLEEKKAEEKVAESA